MIEVVVVGAVLLVLLSMGAAAFLPWDLLFQVGNWLVWVGLVVGVPTGLVYHVLLHRALAPRDELPRGWIWRPLDLHDRLQPRERRRVLPWCYVGGAGFGVIMLGFLALLLSVAAVVARGV